MQKGRLKLEDEECIQKYYVELKENIDSLHLIDKLYSEKVISLEDKERIRNEQSKSERNEILLKVILDSGPGDNFEKFISALRPNYSHLMIVQERSKLSFTQKGQKISKVVQLDKYDTRAKMQGNTYDITVLLVGESRCGKSSTCGTLMRFNREDGSITKSFGNKEIHTCLFNDRKINFVDSPSIEHNRRDSQKLINEVQDSIDRASDGFHAFLLIIKYRKVITNEDLEVVKTLKSLYGPEILKNYCVLVITHGDQLIAENEIFKDWCLQQDEEFRNVYEECGCRAVVIDNTTEDKHMVTGVLESLVGEIDNLQFNGRRYTSDNFRKAESGRKRMLIEEKRSNILEDVAAKCISIIQSSSNITAESTEENVKKLNTLYEESLQLMEDVKRIDDQTGILKGSITIIDSVKGVISEKLDILNRKEFEGKRLWKINEKKEKKILKKIDKMRDEEEKLALKKKLIIMEEKYSLLKLEMMKRPSNLELKNVHLLEKVEQSMPILVNDSNSTDLLNESKTAKLLQTDVLQLEKVQHKSLKTKQMIPSLCSESKIQNSMTVHRQNELHLTQYVDVEHVQTGPNDPNEGANATYQSSNMHNEQHLDQYVDAEHAQAGPNDPDEGDHATYHSSNMHNMHNERGLPSIHFIINLANVLLLVLFVMLLYANNDRNNFWTGMEDDAYVIEYIEKNNKMLQKDIAFKTQMIRDEQTTHMVTLEMIKRNYTLLVQELEIIKKNLTQSEENSKNSITKLNKRILKMKNSLKSCTKIYI